MDTFYICLSIIAGPVLIIAWDVVRAWYQAKWIQKSIVKHLNADDFQKTIKLAVVNAVKESLKKD